jgi:hypothetical protein
MAAACPPSWSASYEPTAPDDVPAPARFNPPFHAARGRFRGVCVCSGLRETSNWCSAPGSLDTRLRYAATRIVKVSRARDGLTKPSFSTSHSAL